MVVKSSVMDAQVFERIHATDKISLIGIEKYSLSLDGGSPVIIHRIRI